MTTVTNEMPCRCFINVGGRVPPCNGEPGYELILFKSHGGHIYYLADSGKVFVSSDDAQKYCVERGYSRVYFARPADVARRSWNKQPRWPAMSAKSAMWQKLRLAAVLVRLGGARP